jgi:uncharacterized OB-fold protein
VSRGFWDAFQAGRLVAQFCTECDRFQHYPKPVCGQCWGSSLEWRDLSGTGKIYTFAIVHRGPSKEFSDTPYAVGMVDLDEGIRMMARIVAPDLTALRIGDVVRVAPEKRSDMVIPSFEKMA